MVAKIAPSLSRRFERVMLTPSLTAVSEMLDPAEKSAAAPRAASVRLLLISSDSLISASVVILTVSPEAAALMQACKVLAQPLLGQSKVAAPAD